VTDAHRANMEKGRLRPSLFSWAIANRPPLLPGDGRLDPEAVPAGAACELQDRAVTGQQGRRATAILFYRTKKQQILAAASRVMVISP